MVKQVKHTYRGMNQDVTKSKHPGEFYFKANNMRILATDSQSTFSISNELGNTLEVTLPSISINTDTNVISYGNKTLNYYQESEAPEIEKQIFAGILPQSSNSQKIIGHAVARNSIILFTTDDLGFDCIWEVEELLEDNYNLVLLYCRNLEFSSNNPIQALFNYENEVIQKVYWVDGNKQLRFMNIKHSIENGDIEELIDLNSNTINIVGNFDLSQPIITDITGGGIHTAGKIQYAYNLYRLNSSQTKLSPLSELVPLDKGPGLGGGEVNEIVGATPIVNISDIDPEFTHLRLYSVKYTSYNQIPAISLLADIEVDESGSFTYFDDGNIISTLSIEEFAFLGSELIIPKHIESKDNVLFSANLQEVKFEVDIDCRAFSHKAGGGGTVYDNVRPSPTNSQIPIGTPYTFTTSNYSAVPKKIDAVNLDYDIYKFQADGTTIGGEGPYLKVQAVQTPMADASDFTFLKDNEIYRIGIQFYNILGQVSFVSWIGDYRTPIGNLIGNYNTLKVELKPAFYTWLNDNSNFESDTDKPVGYKIVRADRTLNDRTILCQGSVNGMMSNTTDTVNGLDNDFSNTVTREKYVKGNIMPSLQRTYDESVFPMLAMEDCRKLNPQRMLFGSENINPNGSCSGSGQACREVIDAAGGSDQRADTYQFNKIIQLHTPEVMFESVPLSAGLQFRVIGGHKSNQNYYWGAEINNITLDKSQEAKTVGGISPHANGVTNTTLNGGSATNLLDSGIFGPSRNSEAMEFNQFYRDFTGGYVQATNNSPFEIYGAPEFTERGQGLTYYNNNPGLSYYNSLQPMLTDQHLGSNSAAIAITSVNSYGARCITFVEGSDNPSTELISRKSLENIYSIANISETDIVMLVELTIPEYQIYLGNIYGGNTYQSKRRNTYLEIGEYKDIADGTNEILSAGDTFVQNFRFLKIGKTETEIHDTQSAQYSEIVEYKVETTVDLKNRNDLSLTSWESRFQPRDEEYHKYNRVYSQQPTLIENVADDFNFRKVKAFDSRIIASKTKVPGENIDSWSDYLINTSQDLDGKYGPINSMINFRDEIYTLQDEGVAAIGINPRVQVQGDDGISVELGTGSLLYDYKYLTTKSGSINKWSTISSNSGFYYYDALNKSWNRFNGKGIEGLSDSHGMHSFFVKNTIYDDISIDNPLLGTGVVGGYNPINNDIYLTVLQGTNPFTICFNEMSNSFTSFYDYKPAMYIIKGFRMITPNSDRTELWEHFKGDYNSFYGDIYNSNITYLVNPQERDCIFNNIEYKSEIYIDGVDMPKQTLNQIKASNEYQTTDITPLILNTNINRKFRMWKANIPRALNNGNPSLDRMRGHWIFLELSLADNTTNQQLILHDMLVNYTAYN